jgi:CRP-like cAMP-binding protein
VTGEGVDRLRGAALFAGLPDDILAEALEAARPRRAARGDFLFREGRRATHVFVVSRGRVKLTQLAADGHQVILRIVGPGAMFSVISAVATGVYPVSAEAVADTDCLCWDGAAVRRMMRRCPDMALNALQHVVAHLQDVQNRLRELATERVEQRIARAIVRLASQSGRRTAEGVEIDFPISRQELAEITGTTLFTVSRTLGKFEEAGLIRARRQRITIRATHRLVAVAEDLPGGTGG